MEPIAKIEWQVESNWTVVTFINGNVIAFDGIWNEKEVTDYLEKYYD